MNEIIKSYKELSIGKYQELQEILNDKEADAIDKNLAIVSVLTDIDTVELYNMPVNRFSHLLQNASFLSDKPVQGEMKSRYKVGKYTLIPQYELGKLSTAQFVDYQTFIKEPDKYLCELLAVFLIPEGKQYNRDYDLDDVSKAIKENLCVEDALTLSAFFLILYRALLKATLTYFRRQMKKLKKQKLIPKEQIEDMERKIQALEQDGVGLP